jgi:hypothetical protein
LRLCGPKASSSMSKAVLPTPPAIHPGGFEDAGHIL